MFLISIFTRTRACIVSLRKVLCPGWPWSSVEHPSEAAHKTWLAFQGGVGILDIAGHGGAVGVAVVAGVVAGK